ncbi:proton-conducting transporter membrane subunit [Haloarculaceae archaeon H-GB2-1]|nr:proton-conducting transporter membrane subunit [Haloarculaceae archaeon H-GB11]MEA5407779.1 proton-conducting transporter membrane subunit [Haloarculaceae archaeon H-GB2-1]
MSEVLPWLVVAPVVPLASLPILAFRFDRVGWPVAAITATVHTALATWTAWTVAVDGPTRFVVGGLPARLGIELAADALSASFLLLVSLVGLWVLAYTRRGGPRSNLSYALYLALLAGLSGLCITRDVFNLYVFLEISGLAGYALVALGDGRDAAPAALRYLLVGTVGASLYLLGIGYLYVATGTLNMSAMAAELVAVGHDGRLVVAAFAFVTVGLGVKMALFPVHTWKPDAYRAAPAGIAALLAALVSTVAGYAFLRLLLSVFTATLFGVNPLLGASLRAAAVLSVGAGAVLAVRQRDVRRMLAYSSVSQFGVAVAGFALATPLGLAGGVVHLLGHAVMKSGAFAAVGVVEAATGARTVDEFAGLATDVPVTSGALAALSFGLVGIPRSSASSGSGTSSSVRSGAVPGSSRRPSSRARSSRCRTSGDSSSDCTSNRGRDRPTHATGL